MLENITSRPDSAHFLLAIFFILLKMLQERVSELSEYFLIKRNLSDLIKNNASAVFFDSWPALKKKLKYFIEVMHVDVRDIAKCKALTMELDEIKVFNKRI